MSLPAFHLFFISLCTALAILVALICIQDYRHTGDVASLWLGILALPAAAGLVAYSGWVRRKLSKLTIVTMAVLILSASETTACPVCFGDPSSPLAKSAALGVTFLAGVVGAVLAAIAFVAFTWARRARNLERLLHVVPVGTVGFLGQK